MTQEQLHGALTVEIVDRDGRVIRVVQLPDPRVRFCELRNAEPCNQQKQWTARISR